MKRGRPARSVPADKVAIHIATTVLAEVELLLANPASPTLKRKHGALSALVEQLLIQWLNQQRKEKPDASNPSHSSLGL